MDFKAAQKPIKVWVDVNAKGIYAKFEPNEVRRIDASIIDEWEYGCRVCGAYADEIESIGEARGLLEQVLFGLERLGEDNLCEYCRNKPNERVGRCYELSGKYVLENPNAILVHGTINSNTLPIAHAWVETEADNIFDLVEDKTYSHKEYYKKRQAVKIVSYSHQELLKMVNEYGHWGPWQERGYKDIPNLVHH